MGPASGISQMFIHPSIHPPRKYLSRALSMEGSVLGTAGTVEDKRDTAMPLQNLLHVGKQILNK